MTAKTPRKRAVKPPPEQPESPAPILAFKGFDQAMQCRGFQYAVGQTYTMDGPIEACSRGFHACENPFDVWSYYGVTDSRFAIVETSGETSREQDGDSKIAAASITIKAELTLPEFTGRAVDWIVALTKGGKEADDCYDAQIGSSGNDARIGSSGYGAWIDASGENGVVAAAGRDNGFRIGAGGCASVPYHDGTRVRFAVAYAGENVEPGVWYSVNERGEFVREDRS